jgi:hypothetical protein
MKPYYKRPFFLKLVAIVTMIIDHVGAIFFPHIWWFRLIGRFSFPLFGYLLATGFDKTSNKFNYSLRLGLFAVISQYFYNLAFHPTHLVLNIFATLFVTFIILVILTTERLQTWTKTCLVGFLLLTSFLLSMDYGVIGILSIISMYFLQKKKWSLFLSQIILWGLYCSYNIYTLAISGTEFSLWVELLQLFAPLAIGIIYIIGEIKLKTESWQLSKKQRKIIQYGFYLFYPVHLLLLHLISIIK